MSIHIAAKPGDIASTVLLPGDPLRAKYIAENFFEDAVCYNEVRGMYGFTGMYKGKRVSVQGTGMGIPSISIYVNELISEYQVTDLIRVGTCGGIRPDTRLRDVILAMSASTDSQINRLRFGGIDYAPTASFPLLKKAYDAASTRNIDVKVGPVFTSDSFYHDDPDYWRIWAAYGILAIEMETTALYTLAAKFHVHALSILTVSDDLVLDKQATSEERQTAFTQMMEIALETAIAS
jgi:purine-nucleoside phosphorylase